MPDDARPELDPAAAERLSGDPGLQPVAETPAQPPAQTPAPGGEQAPDPRAAKRRQLARAARLWAEIEELHEQTVEPDPAYAKTGPSQYPEGIVAVSGGAEVDDNFEDALTRAGLPPVGGDDAQPSTDPRSAQ